MLGGYRHIVYFDLALSFEMLPCGHFAIVQCMVALSSCRTVDFVAEKSYNVFKQYVVYPGWAGGCFKILCLLGRELRKSSPPFLLQ